MEFDDIFYQTLAQCNPQNFHVLDYTDNRTLFIIVSLQGKLTYFCQDKSSGNVDNSGHFSLRSIICPDPDAVFQCSFFQFTTNVDDNSGGIRSLIAVNTDSYTKFSILESAGYETEPSLINSITMAYCVGMIRVVPDFFVNSPRPGATTVVFAGNRQNLATYSFDGHSLKMQKCGFLEKFLLPGDATSLDFSPPTNNDENCGILALGCDSGDFLLFTFDKSQDWQVVRTLQQQYDMPIAFSQFVVVVNQHLNVEQEDSCLIFSSALGPVGLFRENSDDNQPKMTETSLQYDEYCIDSFENCLKLQYSDNFDVVVCCHSFRVGETFYVAVGTFGARLLVYKVDQSVDKADLVVNRKVLAPIMGIYYARGCCCLTILTCVSIQFFNVKFCWCFMQGSICKMIAIFSLIIWIQLHRISKWLEIQIRYEFEIFSIVLKIQNISHYMQF